MKKIKFKITVALVCVAIALGAVCATTGAVLGGVNASGVRANAEIAEFFHDQGYLFMEPLEPSATDSVTYRIRVEKGSITAATLRYTLDVEQTYAKSDEHPDGARYTDVKMVYDRIDDTGYYEYWKGVVPAQSSPYYYHFKLENKKETLYVNGPTSFSEDKPFSNIKNDWYVMPGFSTSAWSQGATWYSIMPDSFYNGDVTNDKYSDNGVYQNPWGVNHSSGASYVGGDLQGIMDKLDYIKQFNVTGLFVNPIWASTHNAGYGAYDLYQIDPSFGNEQKLSELVNTMHENDIKVMLDGVFRYLHSDSVLINNSSYFPFAGGVNSTSPYYDMFQRNDKGELIYDWGQPIFDFSDPDVRDYIYRNEDSVMQYYLRKFDIDGWRLDAGQSLSGSSEMEYGTVESILKDMRAYVKSCGEDKLFLSEHGDGALLYDYTLDAKWGHGNFAAPTRQFLKGHTNVRSLLSTLYSGVTRLPRSVANSNYNYTANHDYSRTAYAAGNDLHRILTGNLLTFTYVGSTCIYFGDEVGIYVQPNLGVTGGDEEGAAPTSFGPFNWDESTWNYHIYRQTRALGEMREQYRKVFKDGAYITLYTDIRSDTGAYARFNEHGNIVTLLNPSDDAVKGVKLEVRRANVKDGATLTDYLTGKRYTVKDGFVTVDIPAGGSVLVSGDAGNARGELYLASVGGATGNAELTDGDLTIESNCVIGGTADKLQFWARPAFNRFELSAMYQNGSAGLMVRASESENAAFYAVSMQNGTGTVRVRKTDGASSVAVAQFSVPANATLTVTRESSNVFSVRVNGATVAASRARCVMCETVAAGVFGCGGGTLSQIAINALAPQTAFTFYAPSDVMFAVSGGAAQTENGTYKITGSEKGTFALVRVPCTDFTYTAKTLTKPTVNGSSFGVVGHGGENDYLTAGYSAIGGKTYIVFGRCVNGDYRVLYKVPYEKESAQVRIVRTGMYWRAQYLNNNVWTNIGEKVNANFANFSAGLYALGTCEARFAEAELGENGSYVASTAHGYIDLSGDTRSALSVSRMQADNIRNWRYVTAGFALEDTGYNVMRMSTRYTDFKWDYTFSVQELLANGYVGMRFGQSGMYTNVGYTLRFGYGGKLTLCDPSGAQIANATFALAPDGTHRRVVVLVEDGNIRVYENGTKLLIDTALSSYAGGYISYVSEGAKYTVHNRYEADPMRAWQVGIGEFDAANTSDGATISMNATANGYTYAGMLDTAMTDFIFAGNVKLNTANALRDSVFGVLIGGNAGRTYVNGGLLAGVDSSGNVFIKDANGVLASAKAQFDPLSFYLAVAYSGNKICIYVQPHGGELASEPALTFTVERRMGGTLNLYAENAKVKILRAKCYALGAEEDYKDLALFTDRTTDVPPPPEPTVNEGGYIGIDDGVTGTPGIRDWLKDGSQSTLNDWYKYSDGEWSLNGNVLSCDSGTNNWDAGATFTGGKSADVFEFSFKIKKTGTGGGFAGVLLNKSSVSGNHQAGGILVYTDGYSVYIFDASGNDWACEENPKKDADGFFCIKIVQKINEATGKHELSFYDLNNEGKSIESIPYVIEDSNRSGALFGYISLVTASTQAQFSEIHYQNYIS